MDGERDFLWAIELNPSYPTAYHWYAINHLVPQARFDAASSELQRALDLDPLALAIRMSLGMTSYFAGDNDETFRSCRARFNWTIGSAWPPHPSAQPTSNWVGTEQQRLKSPPLYDFPARLLGLWRALASCTDAREIRRRR